MENERHDTTPKAPTKSGRIFAKIGMGIVGEIIAAVGAVLLSLISFLWENEWEALVIALSVALISYCVFAIPCVAEFVRKGGMLSGGHDRRMPCYIGAAIGSITTLCCVGIPLSLNLPPNGFINLMYLIGLFGLPVFSVFGAIFGYNLYAIIQNYAEEEMDDKS